MTVPVSKINAFATALKATVRLAMRLEQLVRKISHRTLIYDPL